MNKQVIDSSLVPKHVGIIMDGNGRWAKKRSMPVSFGHSKGVDRIEDTLKYAVKIGISKVTVFAFSSENWNRSQEEIEFLFKLAKKFYINKIQKLIRNEVRINVLGDRTNLPKDLIEVFDKMEQETADFTKVTLNIAFNYGGRDEITRAVNLLRENHEGVVTSADIQANLYPNMAEDLDLVIRTSGEKRLSNFMLWQAAYAEFVFTDVLWPDFTEDEFEKCILEYQMRDRRFGGRSE